jgi:hypothetical protein
MLLAFKRVNLLISWMLIVFMLFVAQFGETFCPKQLNISEKQRCTLNRSVKHLCILICIKSKY